MLGELPSSFPHCFSFSLHSVLAWFTLCSVHSALGQGSLCASLATSLCLTSLILSLKQNKTKQNKTKQNKTKQNKTKQNKTKHLHF
jgi:mannitol-specific phosphotransferase system IIBC component